MSEKKDYFEYVENVLGVKSVILSSSTAVDETHLLLICVESYADYASDEKDLLAKMIAALKIDLEKIKVVSLSENQKFKSEYLIYFVDKAEKKFEDTNSITTFSPRALLKKPELKKTAWAELQKVISYFSPAN